MIGSIIIAAVIYLLLQVAFLGDAPPEHLHEEGRSYIQLAFCPTGAGLEPELAGLSALCGCLCQRERNGRSLYRLECADDLRFPA